MGDRKGGQGEGWGWRKRMRDRDEEQGCGAGVRGREEGKGMRQGGRTGLTDEIEGVIKDRDEGEG